MEKKTENVYLFRNFVSSDTAFIVLKFKIYFSKQPKDIRVSWSLLQSKNSTFLLPKSHIIMFFRNKHKITIKEWEG